MKSQDKTAIVLGATGLTGSILVTKLISDDRYNKIKVFTRKPLDIKNSKLDEVQCNLLELNSIKDEFIGDEVFCCIGTTTKKTPNKELYKQIDFGIPVNSAALCKENNIPSFLVMSSLGANAKSSIFYNKTKGEMEQAVLNQNIENTFILRPSIIIGERSENRIGENIGVVLMKIIQPFLNGSLTKYRTINAEVIANAMIELANNGSDEKVILSDQIQKLGNGNLSIDHQ